MKNCRLINTFDMGVEFLFGISWVGVVGVPLGKFRGFFGGRLLEVTTNC